MTQNPPIEWPEVTLGGKQYTLKYSCAVNYRAAKMGVDLRGLGNPVAGFAAIMDIFAVMVAPQFLAMGDAAQAPTGEQWAEQISMDDFKAIADGVARAYTLSTKVQPAEASPTPETPASTGQLPN